MMTRILYSRLTKSEALENYAQERIGSVVEKFGGLSVVGATVRLSVLNARQQPGPDTYACELRLQRRKGMPVLLREVGANLYAAIAATSHRLLNLLARDKGRRASRRLRLARQKGELPYVL